MDYSQTMTDNASPLLSVLEGHLERITYFNAENNYTIAILKTSKTDNPVTLVGIMAGVSAGQSLKLQGTWEIHPRYGQQFKVESFEVTLPSSVDGIRKYLESGAIKGIGPKMAARLVDRFGTETLDIIERDPEKLLKVQGIGKNKADLIFKAWKDHHVVRSLMQFLQTIGVQTSFCGRIFQKFGVDAENIIRRDPYRLANDISGISFYAADTVARTLGVSPDAPQRIRACIMHLMQQSINEGHIFTLKDHLLQRCQELFQIKPNLFQEALDTLSGSGELVIEQAAEYPGGGAVYLKAFHQAETDLADRLKAMLSIPVAAPEIDPERILWEIHQKLAIKLSDEQLDVLQAILTHRIAIITGGPGTGKTTLIRSIHTIFTALGRQVLMAAPTGRASRRLAEVTGQKAETIHRLLGYNFKEDRFDKNQDNPLDADAVIIDEASMVDALLMFHLMRAIPMTAALILVGDIFQLPSVGPGNVLADMIVSNRIPVFYLKEVFRQAHESPIVTNAHKVRHGQTPDLTGLNEDELLSGFYFIEQDAAEKVADKIVDLCGETLPRRFGFDAVHDIQVLTPMHKGIIGTTHLNQVLQKVLNSNPALIQARGSTFKLGDKVMHLKNNYQKDVFNGDIGTISRIDKKEEMLVVRYFDRDVNYDFTELDEISLAYAITVHKSQGSEYPAVIVPLMTQHFVLLQRNLLYTAITRATQLIILIGTRKALAIALKNNKPRKRLTGLAFKLKFGFPETP